MKEINRPFFSNGRSPYGDKKSSPSHCPHGHEYTEENTRIIKSGSKVCKRCESIRRQIIKHNDPDHWKKYRQTEEQRKAHNERSNRSAKKRRLEKSGIEAVKKYAYRLAQAIEIVDINISEEFLKELRSLADQ